MSDIAPRKFKWDWFTAVGAVTAVSVVLLVAYAGVTRYTGNGDTPTYTSQFSPQPNQPKPVAAFLGDSYTFGAGASPQQGYAPTTAVKMCWSYAGFGQGGTGYTNPGQTEQHESVYQDRVADVAAVKPNVVIVQGTTSDRDPATTFQGATRTFQKLAEALPGVPIVVVGPASPPNSDALQVASIKDAISEAANDAGLPFLDPAGEQWIPNSIEFFIPDGIHPNDAGHARFSDGLYSQLKSLKLPQSTDCNQMPAEQAQSLETTTNTPAG